MSNCLTCDGLIMEPNKVYGYGGKICHCAKVCHSELLTDLKESELARQVIKLQAKLKTATDALEEIHLNGGLRTVEECKVIAKQALERK